MTVNYFFQILLASDETFVLSNFIRYEKEHGLYGQKSEFDSSFVLDSNNIP
jgi:hypothetical protein